MAPVVVGLTGGIGSGKSAVAERLGARGAVVLDADVAAREVIAPGRPAYRAVLERFGPGVVGPDRCIDRAALARIVFADPVALGDLNSLTHPPIVAAMAAALAAERERDSVVILDVPLLVEGAPQRWSLDGVIVVDAPVEVALGRLVHLRGMDEGEARARIASQATRRDRAAIADLVIDNCGDLAHLEAEVERAWAWVCELRQRRERTDPPPRASHIP